MDKKNYVKEELDEDFDEDFDIGWEVKRRNINNIKLDK